MSSYEDESKLVWLDEIHCHACGEPVNAWDKRCSRALGYKNIVCESCIAEEYGISVGELRDTMQTHFGLVPCPGI